MSDTELREVPGKTLEAIGRNARAAEMQRKLIGLSTNGGKNYAEFELVVRSPRKGLKIQAKKDPPPDGTTKICDGQLTIDGKDDPVEVTAYRLK